ncbi:dihydrofolate reductase [Comamonas faecalis]|uniref:Dihydrofolate reductase n=1 Tax=Comamonas faecalis TaxID=1387849 RepID=A0ABP7R8P3_9BURK
MEIALIYARATNGVIGQHGTMPWHLPQDLAHFKQLTHGAPVLMGRKTWDSLPPRFRPLPGRLNLVITRQPDWHADGAQRAASLAQALELARQSGTATAWVIGGGQVFADALPLAQRAEVTEIAQAFDGDTFAPELGAGWREAQRSHQVDASGLQFDFVRYLRQEG